MSMPIREYKSLRRHLRGKGIRTRINGRYGLPFLSVKYRNRSGIAAGMIILIILLSFFSKFIWIITIEGNKEIPASEIIGIIGKHGLYKGAYSGDMDVKEMERYIIKDLPDIRWISINLTGCKAEIEIKEKYKSPRVLEKSKPCNIKSSRDAVIVKTNVTKGTAMTKAGSAVIKGQLLISGVVENENTDNMLVHANGEILGRTNYKKTYKAAKKKTMDVPTENRIIRRRGNLLWFSFPIDFEHVSYDTYRSITKEYAVNVSGTQLPFSVTKQFITEMSPKEYSVKENKQVLNKIAALNEAFCFKDKEIESRKSVYSEDDKFYYLEADYKIIEDLSVESEIYVQ